MPTYEYQCRSCGHRFEEMQRMTAEPLKRCPKCGKSALRRLFGGGLGIIFKGSGFYTTDYKRSSSVGSSNGSSKSSSASTDSSSTGSSESKSTDKPASDS